MKDYQHDFIEFLIEQGVLLFGDFTLKSGRQSPYFFNAGEFKTGQALAKLGQYYAQSIVETGVEYDMLFGPAYKGIPLVSAVSIALFEQHGIDKPFAYDRKEVKDHGEGGKTVGSPIEGRVLIIDDVVSAGTAFREAHSLITGLGAEVVGIAISMDRQERGKAETSAVQEVKQQYGSDVISIINLQELIDSLKHSGRHDECDAIRGYQAAYGVI